MIPVQQTAYGVGKGNCLEACIASIFELPIEAVPSYKERGWDTQYQKWLAQYNLGFTFVSSKADARDIPKGYSILVVEPCDTPEASHALVAYEGDVVHEPSPIPIEWECKEYYILFYPLDITKPHTLTREHLCKEAISET